MVSRRVSANLLVPYLPRLAVQWADETPDLLWRAIEGSLVFVDISGFTALSERLAKRGPVGAEELTGTLSSCFAELLAVAYGAGGSLLKFGGDALLLLFDDEDHARRACASALQMRATMRQVGRVTTSAGTMRLRMSVGVNSGVLHFFRVGGSHRELILTGPATSATVAMEATAEAGEIVVSPATAEGVDKALIGAPKGPGVLLRSRATSPEPSAFPTSPVRTTDLGMAIPVGLRSHLLAGTVESEHRHATIAFIHFDDVDHLISSRGPEAVAHALDQLVTTVQSVVDDHGVTFLGTDVDRDGGKVILVSGAPQAQGDDEGRMLRALRRIVDEKYPLPIRVGVNRGHVFVGEVGPPYRRTYTVMGDAVNLAARLMAKATAGQILTTRSVLDHAATRFESEALPPFMVKGKAQPVEAFALGAQGRRRAAPLSQGTPLVGREGVLKALLDALEQCQHGQGGLVDIAGDAGIGKSRLLEELRCRVNGTTVVRAFCEPYERKTPYFAFRFLLRGLLGFRAGGNEGGAALATSVGEVAPALGPWLPLIAAVADVNVGSTPEVDALEPRFRRERTRRAVVDLLRAAVTEPTIMVIEDAQFLDALSAELLEDVAIAATAHPWLICVARRDDPEGYRPERSVVTWPVPLEPLNDGDARALIVAATVGNPLRPDQRAALVRQAGGNPLFLEQMLRARLALGGGDQLPDSLEAVVAAEIDRLAPRDRRLLRYSAVLGSTFESALLSDVVDGDGGATAGAVRRLGAFLESAGTGLLRFRNECYRQVAYQTLPFSRRRDLHARAGEAIERSLRDDDAERAGVLSFHFLNALRYDKCWTYALMAAAGAARQYANAEAVELYERALVASPHLADLEHGVVAAAWEALADRALDAGMFDRARAAYGRARRLRAGDVTALAQLCQKESRAAWHQGRAVASVRWIRRGLRYVEGSTDPAHVAVRATLRMLYAQNRQLAGRHRETVRWCELAIEDATASGNRQALADAYTVLDGAYMASGHPEHAVHGALALAIWEDLGLAERQAGLLTHLGAFAYWQGHWDEALALFAKGRDAYLRAGNVVDAAYGTCNISEILIDQGLADEAEPGLLEAIDVWRSVHHPAPIAGALVNLGRIALRRNDFGRALGLFEEAGAASETAIVEADAWLAECLLRQGEAEQAAKLLEPAIKREAASGGTTFVAKLHRLRGYVLAALDRIDEAWPEFQTSLDAGRARGATYEIALTLEAISAVAASAGLPADADAEDERSRLLAQLGVRSTAPPPLPAFAAAS